MFTYQKCFFQTDKRWGCCQIIREGNDITLVGWGAQLTVMEQACLDAEKVLNYIFQLEDNWLAVSNMGLELIMQEGISCELIDLKTLLPWDKETVEASVKKTGRLLVSFKQVSVFVFVWLFLQIALVLGLQISHEAPITGGFGAEISATILERCFLKV